MIRILEDLARNSSSATARIGAIRQLREMLKEDDGEREAEESPFDQLDQDLPRIRRKVA